MATITMINSIKTIAIILVKMFMLASSWRRDGMFTFPIQLKDLLRWRGRLTWREKLMWGRWLMWRDRLKSEPQLVFTFHRQRGIDTTQEERNRGLAELEVFRDWIERCILSPDRDGKGSPVMLLPLGQPCKNYCDVVPPAGAYVRNLPDNFIQPRLPWQTSICDNSV